MPETLHLTDEDVTTTWRHTAGDVLAQADPDEQDSGDADGGDGGDADGTDGADADGTDS